jgi:DNA phosphorothioation-dependent restriction protein DptG
MVVDLNGNEVKVGSKVKVLYIKPKITEYLPDEEVNDIKSMLNEILAVYEVDEYAWVEKWWDRGDGKAESHSLALSPQEMELIM